MGVNPVPDNILPRIGGSRTARPRAPLPCPRACGDPSPPHHSQPKHHSRAANPCRGISPLGHTLLSNLLLPVGASLVGARLVFSRHSSPLPPVVLAHAETHPLFLNHISFRVPQGISLPSWTPTPVVLAHAGTHLLPTIPHPNIIPSAAKPSRRISPLGHTLLSNLLLPVGESLGARFRSSNQVIELVRSQRHKAETAYLLVVYRSICGYGYACRHALLPRTDARGLLKQAPCGRPSCVFPSFFASLLRVLAHAEIHPLPLNQMSFRVPRGISLPSPPPFRCPRACGDPSPPLEPNVIPSPSRNLAAGSHTPLQPTSSRRGLPRGRPSCVLPSFFAPLRVLAHAEIHPLPLNQMSFRVPQGISSQQSPLTSLTTLPCYVATVREPPVPAHAPLRVLAHAGTHLLPTIPHPNIIPNAAKPCRGISPSFFASPLCVLAHAGTHLLPTIPHPNIIPNAAKPCRGISPLGHTFLSNLLLPVGASLVVARLVFSHHSSHPLSVSSRMRGPIPSS